tara:strand:- start:15595 stop:16710 length:1116 start_codon:yes stop_codon:yes gene_type:complete
MAQIKLGNGHSYTLAKQDNIPVIVSSTDSAGAPKFIHNDLTVSASNGDGRLSVYSQAPIILAGNSNSHAQEIVYIHNPRKSTSSDTRIEFRNEKNQDNWSMGLGASYDGEFILHNGTSFGSVPTFRFLEDEFRVGYCDGHNSMIRIYSADATKRSRLRLEAKDDDGAIIESTFNSGGSKRLTLKSGGHEVVRMDNSDGIRFNTTVDSITSDPSYPFHVYCDRDSDWSYVGVIQNDDSNTKVKMLAFRDNNSENAYIQSNGAFYGNGTFSSSDGRLKKNVISLGDDILEKVCKLRPVSFNWNEKTNKDSSIIHIGHIAQEVEKIFPDVITSRDNTDNGGFSDQRDINNAALVPHLVKAIQVLEARVKELENK